MTQAAYLRVYLPSETVDAAGGLPPPPHRLEGGPRRLRVTDYGLLAESLSDDALIAVWGGAEFVCPRTPRVRMLEGVLAFHHAYREMGGDAVIPESVARRAATELRGLVEGVPLARSYILTSPWHVPLRWFIMFEPSQRELVETTDELGEPKLSIRYRTGRKVGSERIDHAIEVLRRAGFDDGVVTEVEELGEWIGGFPEDAMIELDYGGVAALFDGAELALDDSAAEVWASIEALDAEDWQGAGSHYQAVASRWASAVAVTWSN